MTGARLRSSLGVKLFAGQVLVILAGAATLALVALAVAPGRFHAHVRERLGLVPDDVGAHLDEAFGEAVLFALAVAIAAALIAAIAVSVFLAARVIRPLRELAAVAERYGGGSYAARMRVAGSDEVATLARAFNGMADALEGTERRRAELLADVQHELRTPVATIEAYVEGLADGVIEPGEEAWRVLGGEASRIGRLAEDLRDVSRAQERQLNLRTAPADLAPFVEAAVRTAAPRFAAKGVTLGARVEPGAIPVDADLDRLGEVLANLLDNALRHTPPGGSVEVAAARRRARAEIVVTDTGEGIAAADLPRIFERFYRADPARERGGAGSGIGLTITRAIVDAHGGTLRAESEGRGRGSRFAITLPVRADAR